MILTKNPTEEQLSCKHVWRNQRKIHTPHGNGKSSWQSFERCEKCDIRARLDIEMQLTETKSQGEFELASAAMHEMVERKNRDKE